MTIKHLAYRIAHKSALQIGGLADAMGMLKQTLTNCLNTTTETHNLNIQKFEMLVDFADGNLDAAEYFAAKANAVVIQLPEIPDLGDMGLLDSYMSIIKEFGDLAGEFQSAYSDGEITNKEFDKIDIEVTAVQAKLLAFKARIKKVVR